MARKGPPLIEKSDIARSIESRLNAIAAQSRKALFSDAAAAFREIKGIRRAVRRGGDPAILRQRCVRLMKLIETSAAVCHQRRTTLPRLQFNPLLPIMQKRDELVSAIERHRIVIVSGETGSGKTTQLPKLCLLAGRGVRGIIGVTQPRRIAAITVSQRIAEELGEPLGETVGYKIRFKETIQPGGRIKVMTDGILLAEAHQDPFLNEYDTLIVDEAHERSLNIDFTLGLLMKLLHRRRDLTLLITSATIDTEKFSRVFDNAPVIEVSGRLYPVEMRYQEPETSNGDDTSYIELAVQAVERLASERQRGDILIFMPTEQDIRDTCELLQGRRFDGTLVLPLFARLAAVEQQKVFHPFQGRKIIVATNVAETSITIPGIRYVIDTGLARILQYTPRSRTTTLPVVPVSQSSADQRMGRCGRVANGVCIRLYSEDDYAHRPRFTAPEILRSNLAEVILRMIALKMGDVAAFPFIDPPAPKSIQDGYSLLTELGAITRRQPASSGSSAYTLTPKGQLMAKLPLDPRLSCMLLEADQRGCLDEIAIIAAALSLQDPRERPLEKQSQADMAHARFNDPLSDFVTLLRIWQAYGRVVQKRASWNQVKQFCRDYFLSFPRMREWQDIYHQLIAVLAEHDIHARKPIQLPEESVDCGHSWYTAVHQAILSGFLSNIAMKKEKQIFQAAHHREVMLFPGSGLFKDPGEWIVAAEMVETSRLFARCAAVINPDWIAPIAGDQCSRTYLDPHWGRRREAVVVTEQVSLYGLIVQRRPRHYGPINPLEASEIFIRNALIEGDVRRPLPFMVHNRQWMEQVKEMENRLRRRDLMVSEQDLLQFYQDRLGTVYDLRTLKKRISQAGGDGFLRMKAEDLLNYRPDPLELAQYPTHIHMGDSKLNYKYHFEPGHEADGVTVHVPAVSAAAVPAETFQWLVPGLLKEKIAALIKGLPKELRKQLVPVAETAALIAAELPIQPHTGLITSLSRFIQERFNISIPPAAWDESVLPDYLRMRIAVTDNNGRIVQSSRDTVVLKQSAGQHPPDDLTEARKQFERRSIEQWDLGDLAERITLKGPRGGEWTVFPALVVEEDVVALRALASPSEARKAHRQGVKTLLCRHFSQDVKYLRKNLKLPPHSETAARYFGGRKILEDQLLESVLDSLFAADIRTRAQFETAVQQHTETGISGQGQGIRQALLDLLSAYQEARLVLVHLERTHIGKGPIQEFLDLLETQLNNLVPQNFLTLYDESQMRHIIRYIGAVTIRAQRGVVDLDKDRRKADQIDPYSCRLNTLVQSLNAGASPEKHAAVEAFFWLLEEYKISIFAQEIKTAQPVSAKRLEAKLKEIEGMV